MFPRGSEIESNMSFRPPKIIMMIKYIERYITVSATLIIFYLFAAAFANPH